MYIVVIKGINLPPTVPLCGWEAKHTEQLPMSILCQTVFWITLTTMSKAR